MNIDSIPRATGALTLLCGLALTGANIAVRAEEPPMPLMARAELSPIEITASAPISSLALPANLLPANVQVIGLTAMEQPPSTDLADALQRNLGGVALSPAQGNPYQNDLVFRGFTASPLAGTPQGISVFLDGVRINEVFGDTVNWDFLPGNAIVRVSLLPGGAPAFGLNTLGGALAVETRNGRDEDGGNATLLGGSNGRLQASAIFGTSADARDIFIAGNHVDESGWRDHTASRIDQAFAKFGLLRGERELELSLLGAKTRLDGGQTIPLEMLEQPRAAYTWPDRNENRVTMANLHGIWHLDTNRRWDALVYFRSLDSRNLSSNINHDFDFAAPIDADNAPGSMDRSRTRSGGFGASLQWSDASPLLDHVNRLQAGVALDGGRSAYQQWTQAGSFTPDRTVETFAGEESEVDATVRNRYFGAYFSDTFSIDERWHVTASARWNDAAIDIRDRSGNNAALEGSHRFHRLNPALGVAFLPSARMSAYLGYNEGMRVATPMELTCADPAAPCKLPNAFLADPALKPVIARTLEAGLRGRASPALDWRFTAYRTQIDDDIVFIASSGVNSGYFQNVPRTRRQGLETHLAWRGGALRLSADYSFTEATFESPIELPSPFNSEADDQGRIAVTPGNRLPGVPRHKLSLRADYVSERWQAGAQILGFGSQFARGDENNRDARGALPAYALLNLDARVSLARHWDLLARIDNALDRRYDAFGAVGVNYFRGIGGTFDASLASPTQFRSPGTGRGIFIALRHTFAASASHGRDAADLD